MLTAPRSAECGGNRVWRELTPRVRFTRQRLRENLDAYLMISPWLIGFVGLTVGPVLGSAVLAFTQWNLLSPPRLIGTENFGTLLADGLFWTSLYNTGYYTAFGVPVYILLALLAAVALNVRLRFVNFYRTMVYLPSITPAVASALVWIWNRDEVRTVALGIALSK